MYLHVGRGRYKQASKTDKSTIGKQTDKPNNRQNYYSEENNSSVRPKTVNGKGGPSPQGVSNLPNTNATRSKDNNMRGTASDSIKSLANKKPLHYENKILVIHGIDPDMKMEVFKSKINENAGRRIHFLHNPVILSKKVQRSRTVALELNNEDFELLFNPHLWHHSNRISEFTGHKFWRSVQKRLTTSDLRNSVRDQWTA